MLLAAGLSTLLASAGLQAQTNQLNADIPFDFHAAGKTLPAGTYVLNKMNQSGIFEIRNVEGTGTVLVNAPIGAHYMPKKSELTFVHSGDDYVLSEISVAGATQTNALTPGAVEKNLTRRLGIASMIAVPLHR
jgi:hypothetical protein